QIPGGKTTGGNRQMIPYTTRAMVAAGADGIFMEVHDNINQAKSDRDTQYQLDRLSELLSQLITLRSVIRDFNG
ncbi:3-deoxy-8-phosphooctulonate synthase, partial [bacterium]|nr:3-deoxy-8-phosphooctulonate synthase [bacterium]